MYTDAESLWIAVSWMLCQAGMTSSQIKAAEEICNEQSRTSLTVYSRIVSLAQAKSIQGLRAVFDEVRSF